MDSVDLKVEKKQVTRCNYATISPSSLKPATIRISGYKHVATVVLAASIIQPDTTVTLLNIPQILDVKHLVEIITLLGADVNFKQETLTIKAKGLRTYNIPQELSQHIHGAVYLLPVLLGRLHRVTMGQCGGCPIGEKSLIGQRPISHMLSVLEKFGANFTNEDGLVVGETQGFIGCEIDVMDYSDDNIILNGPSVSGATKTAILAAALAHGETIIKNPYPKPDVTELLKFLEQLNYKIERTFESIKIKPPEIANEHVRFSLMSDISQIMTYITIAVYHEVELSLTNITRPEVEEGLGNELLLLDQMGVRLKFIGNQIKIVRPSKLKAININVTSIGIYSDHQPFFALMLTKADKPSLITEKVWKSRFSYAEQLTKLGMKLEVNGNCLKITPRQPNATTNLLIAQDLRAAAVLLIAALQLETPVRIEGIHHLERGYDDFMEDLKRIGVNVQLT